MSDTRPLDKCWGVVINPKRGKPWTSPLWCAGTRRGAIAKFMEGLTGGPSSHWRYHYRQGVRAVRVAIVLQEDESNV